MTVRVLCILAALTLLAFGSSSCCESLEEMMGGGGGESVDGGEAEGDEDAAAEGDDDDDGGDDGDDDDEGDEGDEGDDDDDDDDDDAKGDDEGDEGDDDDDDGGDDDDDSAGGDAGDAQSAMVGTWRGESVEGDNQALAKIVTEKRMELTDTHMITWASTGLPRKKKYTVSKAEGDTVLLKVGATGYSIEMRGEDQLALTEGNSKTVQIFKRASRGDL